MTCDNTRAKKKTRDRLALLGNKAETYDDIINKLIDCYLSRRPKKRHIKK